MKEKGDWTKIAIVTAIGALENTLKNRQEEGKTQQALANTMKSNTNPIKEAIENNKNVIENYALFFSLSERGQERFQEEQKRIMSARNSKQKGYPIVLKRMHKNLIKGKSLQSYIDKSLEESSLPQLAKDIIRYLPWQESTGRLNITSPAGARGLWQFMPSTARKYGLTVTAMNDERTNPESATKAAIAYIEAIYKKIKNNKDYQALIKEFGLPQENNLLTLLTINAYNSGSGHMTHACKIIHTELKQEAQKYVNKKSKLGKDIGLFFYITDKYPKYYRKYQKGMKYKYKTESPSYIFDILMWKLYDENKSNIVQQGTTGIGNFGKGIIENKRLKENINQIAGVLMHWPIQLSILGFILGEGIRKSKKTNPNKISRRDFFKSSLPLLGGYAIGKKIGDSDLTEVFSNEIQSVPQEKTKEIYTNYTAQIQTIYNVYVERVNNDKYIVNPNTTRFGAEKASTYNYYPLKQHFGDIAFEQYKANQDSTYLQLSEYFYNEAINLTKKTKKGIYKAPKGGKVTLEEREQYCQYALDIIQDYKNGELTIESE